MADQVVTLRITADGRVAVQAIKEVSTATREMGGNAQQGGQRAAQGLNSASQSASRLAAESTSAKASLLALIGAAGGLAALARGAVSAADAYANINGKLRLATRSQQEFAVAQAEVYAISQRTSSQLDATATLYARLATSTADAGVSQQQLLALTETINQTFVISSATAQQQTNAIIQLTQAFAGGVLRAEEFNSIIENSERLSRALAAGMGVSSGELRRMVNDGEVTVARMVAALQSQAGAIDAEFGTMATTVGRAWTQLGNTVIKSVGELSDATGGANLLAQALVGLGANLDKLAILLGALAIAHVAAAAQTALQDFAQRKVAASALAEAEAQLVKARAMATATGSTSALAAAELRLAEAQTAATAAGVGKIGMLSRLGSGLLSLAGGPIGVAVLALGALYAAYDAIADAEEARQQAFAAGITATEKHVAAIADLNAQLERAAQNYAALPDFAVAANTWASATTDLVAKQTELADKRAEIEAMEYRIQAAQQRTADGAGLAVLSLVPKLQQLRGEYEMLEGVVNRLGGALNSLDFDQLFSPSAAQVAGDMAGQAFAQLTAGAKAAEEQIAENKQGQIAYWQALANTRIEQAQAAGASAARIVEMQAENTALLATIGSTMKKAETTRGASDASQQAATTAADYVKSLQDQVATYGLAGAALERYRAAQQGLSPEQLSNAMAAIAQKEAMAALATESNEAATALESLRAMQSSLDDEIADMSAKLGGASAAQIAFNKTQRDAAKAYAIAAKGMDPRALDAYIKTMEKAKKKLDLSNEADSLAAIEDLMTRITEKSLSEKNPIFMMLDQVGALQEALEAVSDPMSKAFDPEKIKAFTEAVDAANAAIHVQMAGSFKALLGAVQTFTKEGSSSFDAIEKGMAAVAIVQDILAIKAAVVAVLTQGEGEPYSAWARMAAMAAAVAPLLASIGASLSAFGGGGGGPSSQSAEVRQASQGTGTVLGDPTAKSESIANAIEITADATSELVGLNRGMLNALLTLQDALGAAGGFLARGAGDVEFSRQAGDAGNWNWLSGGDSKVIDQGIIIAGGRLQDMLNGIVVGAYQTIETSGGWFHSDDTSDDVADVSDEFGKQFSLVMQSIADTVREGALALGLLPADIEAAMAAYQVEEIRISLKDLSAEEQQAELEAVFSSIFDGLAGAVVPFIEQFQKVGEGLGETLVRVATGVQVTQEAIRQLGLSVNETDPERFAQLSEGLIGAAGGIEAFITGMRGFVEAFAPESQQFAVASDALASAFDQVGLAVPETREGMWDLMQSLDATTEEGREQIATLLRLSGVAAEYYDLLDNQVAEATKYLQSIGLAGASLSNFGRELIEIRQSGARAEDAANLLAISHGREGASAIELAKIHDWTAKQIAAALRRLAQETKDLVSQLYGGQAGTLDGINEQISQLEGNLGGVSGGISAVADAGNELFESWMAGIQSLSEYLDSSLFGDLSPLNPEQQLTEAQSQLDAAIAAAAGGDADALADIPRLMDLYAGLLRDSEGSGGDYNGQILNYRAMLQDLLDMPGPEDLGEAGSSQNPIAVAVSASPELQALYEARDALLAQQEAEHRAVLAQQLAQNLHDLAVLTRTPILEMIELQGVALTDLAADMGVNLDNLTAGSVQALGNMATTLGIPLGELVQALGLNLPDLASGVRELATNLGIDLSALTAETARQLAGLGTSMGANLRELSTALGIDLGKLTDVDSPIFVALGQTIDTLSPDIKTELTPLLDAVKLAAGDEQKNAAVKALRDHVDAMAPDMKNLLAPYFDDIIPAASLDQLDYLEDLQDIGSKQLDVLKAIAGGLDVPGYAVGTGYVPQTGLAMIHEGEAIFPAPMANWMRSNGFPVVAGPAANDGALMRAVDVLREEVVALRRENADGHRATADATREEAGKASRQRDELSRRGEETQRSTRYG